MRTTNSNPSFRDFARAASLKLEAAPPGLVAYPFIRKQENAKRRALGPTSRALTLCVLIVVLGALGSIVAGDRAVAQPAAAASCSFEENETFERRPLAGHHITTKLTKPNADADAQQIKTHFIYSTILGKLASDKAYSVSLRQCAFEYQVDASLDLHFELLSIGQRVHDECSSNRCTGLLSDLLRSDVVDQQAFSRTVAARVEATRRDDSPDPRYWSAGVRRATQEAYRHIYATGTKEQILVSLSAEDFLHTEFEAFLAWFKHQRSAFRDARDGQRLPHAPLPDSHPSTSRTEDVPCARNAHIEIHELNIERHGWGQHSIILINHGFKAGAPTGIENPKLRALCPPYDKGAGALDAPPWHEMAGRISCVRERLNRDRWLILFSKEDAATSSVDMQRYTQAVVGALKSDQCIHPQLQVFLVNFLQQR